MADKYCENCGHFGHTWVYGIAHPIKATGIVFPAREAQLCRICADMDKSLLGDKLASHVNRCTHMILDRLEDG